MSRIYKVGILHEQCSTNPLLWVSGLLRIL